MGRHTSRHEHAVLKTVAQGIASHLMVKSTVNEVGRSLDFPLDFRGSDKAPWMQESLMAMPAGKMRVGEGLASSMARCRWFARALDRTGVGTPMERLAGQKQLASRQQCSSDDRSFPD
jgi:uncharacterized protein YodC (DUF2158 family)